MTNLEHNIQYLWYKGDVSRPCWLCIPLYKESGIHIHITKDAISGEYHVRCLQPKFHFKGNDLQKVLLHTFSELRSLVDNTISLSNYAPLFERTYDFIIRLKNTPRLPFISL